MTLKEIHWQDFDLNTTMQQNEWALQSIQRSESSTLNWLQPKVGNKIETQIKSIFWTLRILIKIIFSIFGD